MMADNTGMYWIFTESGLYKFDGKDISSDFNGFERLSKERISNFGIDKATGKIYLMTYPSDLLVSIHNGVVDFLGKQTDKLFCSSNFRYFSGKSGVSKILLKHGGTVYNNKIKLPFHVNNIIQHDKAEYFLLPDGLVKFSESRLTYLLKTKCSPGSLIIPVEDKIFMYINEKDFFVFDFKAQKLTPVSLRDSMKSIFYSHKNSDKLGIFYQRFQTDLEGNSYFICDNSVFQFVFDSTNKIDFKFLYSDQLNDLHFYSSFKALKRDFVFSTSKGMRIITKSSFKNFVQKDKKSVCYAVIETAKNKFYNPANWNYDYQSSKFEDDLSGTNNSYFVFENKGKIFVENAKNDKLFNLNNPKEIIPTGDSKLKELLGLIDCSYHNEDFYFITRKAFCKISNKKLVIIKKLKENEGDYVSFLRYNNYIYLGTSKGLLQYSINSNTIDVDPLFKRKYIRYLKYHQGLLFVSCYGNGLFVINNGKVQEIKDISFSFISVHSIEFTDHFVWLSSNDGLFVSELDIFNKKLNNKGFFDFYKFNSKDGLIVNEFNGGSNHPSLKSKYLKNFIGFPNMKGFLWFNGDLDNRLPNNSIIFRSYFDGKVKKYLQNDSIYIDSDFIELNFESGYLGNHENLIYEYRIGQNSWFKADPKTKKIYIKREGAGLMKISFKLRTKSLPNEQIKNLYFIFQERYYETIYFKILVVFSLILLMMFSFLYGRFRNKKKSEELKKIIDTKTSQLDNALKSIKETNQALKNNLLEKELLLKEIHHRVKNNLQLVISLLNIQGRKNNYQTIEEFLEKGQTRIMAMVLIHENLYQNESIEKLNVEKYMDSLVQKVLESFGIENNDIVVSITAKNITLNLQTAIPFGLIINEFVTNSVKHAFPKDGKGEIKIVLSQKRNEEFELKMEDNGIGFKTERPTKKSFGLELIKLLTNQLNGTIQMMTEGNTRFHITFKESMV